MRFTALDSWRGLCALWVALYHFRAVSHYYGWPWVRHGDIAVEFFFVLSGFVLAHAYASGLKDTPSRLRFLIRRFGRLWPLHVVTLGTVVLMELARWILQTRLGQPVGEPAFAGDTSFVALAANLVLVHGIGLFRDFTWNVPSWSISVEWTLCLLFVLTSLWRRPLPAAIVMACLGFGLQTWLSHAHPLAPEGHTALVRGIYGFFLGVVIHRLYDARKTTGKALPGWIEWTTPLLLVAAVMMRRWHFPAGSAMCFGALVFVYAFEAGPISRMLKVRVLTWLGQVSYSVYLVHYVLIMAIFGAAMALGAALHQPFLIAAYRTQLLNVGGPWGGDLALLVFVALTLGIAACTYRWIEEPGRLWFNALSDRLTGRKPAPAVRFSEG